MNHSLKELQNFVRQFRHAIENEDPIQGSDAVEYICEFYYDALEAIKADTKSTRREQQTALDL